MRFPGFVGEWEVRKLGEIADIIGGGTPDTTVKEYWNGNIQWFTPTEIKSNFVTKSNRTITELGLKKSSAKLLPKGTILLTTRATIGEVAIANEECSTNQGFQSLITNKVTNNIFISNWIKKNKNEFIKLANGSTFPEIGKSEIENISICLPLISEQHKIASFLSLIDKKILSQSKIIEELKLLKNTFSKMLFSCQLKFKNKNGNEFPKWQEKKFGEIVKIQGGFAFKSNLFEPNGTKVLRIGDVEPRIKLEDFSGIYSQEKPDKKYSVTKNDFVMALSGATFGKVGKILDNNVAYINQRVAKFETDQFLDFFYQLVLTDHFKNYIISIPTASAQPNISNNDIANYKTFIPDIEEQQKIAKFLSSTDLKIDIESQILKKLEIQKNFLLENLFI